MNDLVQFVIDLCKDKNIPSMILSDPSELKFEDFDLGLRNTLYKNKEDIKDTLPVLDKNFIQTKTAFDISDCFHINYFLMPLPEAENILLIGPYLYQAEYSQVNIHILCKQLKLPDHLIRWAEQYYALLPQFPSASDMRRIMKCLMQHLYDKVQIETLTFDIPSVREYSADQISLANEQRVNERYAFENKLLHAIRHGDEYHALQLIDPRSSSIVNNTIEERLPNSLRNTKNYMVILNTLFRKAVETVGVPPVFIDAVSRQFALRIENSERPSELFQLQRQMVKDYCQLVQNQSSQGYSDIVSKAVTYIYGNLSQDLSLSGIAKHLHVSKPYLSSRFHSETKQSLTEFVTSVRMDEAMLMLELTHDSIRDIAAKCGYDDLAYFSKTFRKYKNLSPSSYRYLAARNDDAGQKRQKK